MYDVDNVHALMATTQFCKTDGNIKLETLSELGGIARRYWLEGQQELGRTATRRPR